MQDHTHDVFLVQEEQKGSECGGVERFGYQGGPIGIYGCNQGRGYGGGGVRRPACFNCGEIGHVSRFCTKPCSHCGYLYNPKHVTKDFPSLLKKWEVNKAH